MKTFLEKPYGIPVFLVFLGIIFFIPQLGVVHLFDWDEINFAESSREMLISKNFFQVQINFEPFMEKPPFFFWLQALSMYIFGVNEFAARFPNAVFGIVALITLFKIGKELYDSKFGLIWSLVYLASFLPQLYYKSGIIDPIFNFFIFISVYYLIKLIKGYPDKIKSKYAVLSGLFIGLAIITKGPVALLLLMLTFSVFWGVSRFRKIARIKDVILFIVTIILTTALWYGYEIIQHGPWFLIEFIKYQIELFSEPVAGHQQPFFYHFVVVFIGCFPLSIFALPRLFKKPVEDQQEFEKWMKILFWVVMILFTIVSTKIVHYSSMAYLPLSYIAARSVYSISEQGAKKWMIYLIGFFGLIFSTLLTALPILLANKEKYLLPLNDDPFVKAQLETELYFQGWEFLIGMIYFIAVVIGLRWLYKRNVEKSLLLLAISSGFCLTLYGLFVIPQVEKISQGPSIEFIQNLKGKDVYLTPLNMKSYAHYFYADIQPEKEDSWLYKKKKDLLKERNVDSFTQLTTDEKNTFNLSVINWLLDDDLDKDAYFYTRAFRNSTKGHNRVIFLYQKGGFEFYKREATVNR